MQPQKTSRKAPGNAIWNSYQTRKGRWLLMVMPMAMPDWPKFCAAVGRDEWATDDRFQTLLGLAENGPQIIPELEAMFADHDLDHWRTVLDGAGLIWEPVAELPEVVEDPVLRESQWLDAVRVHATALQFDQSGGRAGDAAALPVRGYRGIALEPSCTRSAGAPLARTVKQRA
jgi:crotonobetainyl-CoA:carnitine CoA-transferase CaiB-like acyl-CoA transferase